MKECAVEMQEKVQVAQKALSVLTPDGDPTEAQVAAAMTAVVDVIGCLGMAVARIADAVESMAGPKG